MVGKEGTTGHGTPHQSALDYDSLVAHNEALEHRIKTLELKLKWMAEKESDTAMGWQQCRERVKALEAELSALRADNERLQLEFGYQKSIEAQMNLINNSLNRTNERLRKALKEIDSIQFDLPAKTQIYDKMKAIAKQALGGGA